MPPVEAGLRTGRTLAACGAALTLLATAYAQPSLQYRLKVGDRLVYERHATVAALEGGRTLNQVSDRIQVWCLARQGDESLLLLDLARTADGRAEPLRAVVLYIDQVGRRRLPPEVPVRLAALEPALDLLPVLPLRTQRSEEWRTQADLYEQRWRCAIRPADATYPAWMRVDFAVEEPLGVAAVLGLTRSGSYWLDPPAGYIMRFEVTEENRVRKTRTTAVAVFRERGEHSAEWCGRRADEAMRFLRALNHEDRLLQEVITRPDELPRTLQQFDRLWAAFKTDVDARSASPFLLLADARREESQGMRSTLEARAALGRRWLQRPAGTWTLQDPAGRTVTCEEARRGVVIECFWSGESAWALRALQPMRVLQDQLAFRPISVLCYNLDQGVERARQVVDQCGGGLTQLLGWPLLQVEELPELPVVRVLDATGMVRGVWIGWQPAYTAARDLALELAKAGR